jgi:hypothetical protein
MEALFGLFNLRARLDVKLEMDSGNAEAEAADVGGTPILFNKAFKSVNSITVSSESNVERRIVYDFTSIPNPTVFYVYVYDTSGARVDCPISWKARGIR